VIVAVTLMVTAGAHTRNITCDYIINRACHFHITAMPLVYYGAFVHACLLAELLFHTCQSAWSAAWAQGVGYLGFAGGASDHSVVDQWPATSGTPQSPQPCWEYHTMFIAHEGHECCNETGRTHPPSDVLRTCTRHCQSVVAHLIVSHCWEYTAVPLHYPALSVHRQHGYAGYTTWPLILPSTLAGACLSHFFERWATSFALPDRAMHVPGSGCVF
jgi:hypothetical protein